MKYIDKDRFYPWLKKEIEKLPKGNVAKLKLQEIMDKSEMGLWDWQPSQ